MRWPAEMSELFLSTGDPTAPGPAGSRRDEGSVPVEEVFDLADQRERAVQS